MHQIKRKRKRLLQRHNMTCPSELICEREEVSVRELAGEIETQRRYGKMKRKD